MCFKPETRDGETIGFAMRTGNVFFFFGTRHFPQRDHALRFPRYRFSYLKQVHGKTVLPAETDKTNEGDGHFTDKPGLALVSQTADCMPILLANEHTVCAIHSGWRGMEQNIVSSAKIAFKGQPPTIAALGPHILKQSFEVGSDVAQRLEAAPSGHGLSLTHPDPAKKFFDLTEMARRQLREAFGAELTVHECLADTVTDPFFHSYRRGKQQADRQFSFVVLNV